MDHKYQQEIAKWSVIFESLTPFNDRTLKILGDRHGEAVRQFLKQPTNFGYKVNWNFIGTSLGKASSDHNVAIDPNQLLREISLLEAYGHIDGDTLSESETKTGTI
jgi:hypothetical protein